MKTKLLSLMLVISMILSFCISVCAQTDYKQYQSFTYKVENGQAVIIDFSETENNVVIPDEIDSISQIVLSPTAFSACRNLESVTISKNVVSINNASFLGCTSLKEIKIDENNANYCVENGILLTKDKKTLVKIPSKLLESSYVVPDYVEVIGANSFDNCTRLRGLIIPEGVKKISQSAFSGTCNITNMVIPKSLTEIEGWAFFGSMQLKTIDYAGTKEDWSKILIGENNLHLKEENVVYGYNWGMPVFINGNRVRFDDQPPVVEEGRTLVPLRAIFEAIDAEVLWDGATQTITAKRGSKTVKLKIGSNEIDVDGNIKVIDVPAKIINERTLVPLRAVSEAFECYIVWDEIGKSVRIEA